ncbi:MAG TPA: transglutaminase-like domain-containing protein [Haliangiales bacterium]|nr:transglutaminase-like domain-containing protein [Haliangiales bacterium]
MLLFLLPIATPPGIAAGIAGTLLGYLLARVGAARGLRLPAGLLLGALAIAFGYLGGQWILDHAPGGGTGVAIQAADATFYGLGCLGGFFGICLLGQRARVFSVIELVAVVGAVAHTFSAHRHHHIHEPRFLSDWAWSKGIDPTLVLAAAGVVAIVLAAVTLVRARRAAKLAVTLLFLLLGGATALLLSRNVRIDNDADTNGLGLAKGDKDDKSDKDGKGDGDGGGGSSSRPPDPVAVALLHDDLPDADVLYFRQAVLSRFNVDRLVEDTSGRFDRDLIGAFPAGGEPLRGVSAQSPAFHRRLHTSMYLLVDHAQPVGIGHPVELRALENPDPRRFVVAYDVDSMFAIRDVRRLVGRTAQPPDWTEAERRHYTELPDDPRYLELSDRLVRDVDPRFVGDDVMKALAIKRYLEKEGFYSLKQKKLVGTDPTAKFLFGGDMRGYCVHFAHAAVFLMRSQGIPARVALGYGVQTRRRGAGSALLIFGNEAHAWPEMYVAGVGWVTFDIYPERSDEPPPVPFDEDLQSALGELARKDKTGGKAADPESRLVIPWGAIGGGAGALLGALLVAAYAVKGVRRARGSSHRLVYRGVLDRLSDLGEARRFGETRERHAARVAALSPTFAALTREHLRLALGREAEGKAALPRVRDLARATRAELRQKASFFARVWAALNPIGWTFTR